jgi:hypothetical protein
MGILIFKGLIARRLNKSFGVKGLMTGFSENSTESSGFLKGGIFMFIRILLALQEGICFKNVINLSDIQGGAK